MRARKNEDIHEGKLVVLDTASSGQLDRWCSQSNTQDVVKIGPPTVGHPRLSKELVLSREKILDKANILWVSKIVIFHEQI